MMTGISIPIVFLTIVGLYIPCIVVSIRISLPLTITMFI